MSYDYADLHYGNLIGSKLVTYTQYTLPWKSSHGYTTLYDRFTGKPFKKKNKVVMAYSHLFRVNGVSKSQTAGMYQYDCELIQHNIGQDKILITKDGWGGAESFARELHSGYCSNKPSGLYFSKLCAHLKNQMGYNTRMENAITFMGGVTYKGNATLLPNRIIQFSDWLKLMQTKSLAA